MSTRLDPRGLLDELMRAHERLQVLDRGLAWTNESRGIEASLRMSYERLSVSARRRWRALGVFPHVFDRAAAEAIWAMAKNRGRATLDKLATYSLVEVLDGRERYRLHELARLFALQQQPNGEHARLQKRHAVHYLQVLQQAGDQFRDSGQEPAQDEWANFLAGQRYAAANLSADAEATELCSGYPIAGADLIELKLQQNPGRKDDWLAWMEAGLEAARKQGHHQREAVLLGNLAGHTQFWATPAGRSSIWICRSTSRSGMSCGPWKRKGGPI